jgi:hypothetical protein
MLKKLFVLSTLLPLLFNGAWASVHITESDHDSHNVPHVHFDTELHQQKQLEVLKTNLNSEINEENSEIENHEHFHVYLNAYVKSDDYDYFKIRSSEQPFSYSKLLISLAHTPPVPPPNS